MLGHFIMAFAGLLAPMIMYLPWMNENRIWFAGLWCLALFHFFVQLMYVMIQRYNLPRFVRVRKRLKSEIRGTRENAE